MFQSEFEHFFFSSGSQGTKNKIFCEKNADTGQLFSCKILELYKSVHSLYMFPWKGFTLTIIWPEKEHYKLAQFHRIY